MSLPESGDKISTASECSTRNSSQEPIADEPTNEMSRLIAAKNFKTECRTISTTFSSTSSTQLSGDGMLDDDVIPTQSQVVAAEKPFTESPLTKNTVFEETINNAQSTDKSITWQPSDMSSIDLNQSSPRKQEMVTSVSNVSTPVHVNSDLRSQRNRKFFPSFDDGSVVDHRFSASSSFGAVCVAQASEDKEKIGASSETGNDGGSSITLSKPPCSPNDCVNSSNDSTACSNSCPSQSPLLPKRVSYVSTDSLSSSTLAVCDATEGRDGTKAFTDKSLALSKTLGRPPPSPRTMVKKYGNNSTVSSGDQLSQTTASTKMTSSASTDPSSKSQCSQSIRELGQDNTESHNVSSPLSNYKPHRDIQEIINESRKHVSKHICATDMTSAQNVGAVISQNSCIGNVDGREDVLDSQRESMKKSNSHETPVSVDRYGIRTPQSCASSRNLNKLSATQGTSLACEINSEPQCKASTIPSGIAQSTSSIADKHPPPLMFTDSTVSSKNSPKSHASSIPPPLMSTCSTVSSKNQCDMCVVSPMSTTDKHPPPLTFTDSIVSSKSSPKSHASSIPPPLMSTCSAVSSKNKCNEGVDSPSSNVSCNPPPLVTSCSKASKKESNIISPSSRDILDDLRSHEVSSIGQKNAQASQDNNSQQSRSCSNQNVDNKVSSADIVTQNSSHVGTVIDVCTDLGDASNKTSLHSKDSFSGTISNGSRSRYEVVSQKADASSVNSPLHRSVIIKQSGSHISTTLADEVCSESSFRGEHVSTSESSAISKPSEVCPDSSTSSDLVASSSTCLPGPSLSNEGTLEDLGGREDSFIERSKPPSSRLKKDTIEVPSNHVNSNVNETSDNIPPPLMTPSSNQTPELNQIIPKPVASPRNLQILSAFSSRVTALSANSSSDPKRAHARTIIPHIKDSSSYVSNSLSKTGIASFEGTRYADVVANDASSAKSVCNSFDTDEISTTSDMQLDCTRDEDNTSSNVLFQGLVDAADESLLDTEFSKRFILAFETTLKNNPGILPGSSSVTTSLDSTLDKITKENNDAVYQMKGKVQTVKNEKFELESRLNKLKDALGENRDELTEKLDKEEKEKVHAEEILHALVEEVKALKCDVEMKSSEAAQETEELNKHLSHLTTVRAEIKSSLEKEREILEQEQKTFAQVNDTRRGVHALKADNKDLERQIEAMTDAIAEEKKSLQGQANDIQSFESELQQLRQSNEETLKELEDEKKELLEMTLALQKKKEILLVSKLETEAALKREKEDLENQIENSRVLTSRDMKKMVKARAKSMNIDAMVKSFADIELKKKASRNKQHRAKARARLLEEKANISIEENRQTVDFESAAVVENRDAEGEHMFREDPITGEIEIEANIKSLVEAEIEQKISEIEARESMEIRLPILRGNSMSTDVTPTTSNREDEPTGEIFVASDDEKSI